MTSETRKAVADVGDPGTPASQEVAYVKMTCHAATFHPAAVVRARWLDPDADFLAARAMWATFMDLTPAAWRGFWEEGYAYCGVFDGGSLVARAAVWRYSDRAWELAAVGVCQKWRRRGLAKEVCSLATGRILDAGRLASCSVRSDNVAMQRTAVAIGFVRSAEGEDAASAARRAAPG